MGFLRRLFGARQPAPEPRDDDWRVARSPIAPSVLVPGKRPPVEPSRADPPSWMPAKPHRGVAFDNRREPVAGTVKLKAGGRVAVVGESHYREVISSICGACGPEGVSMGFTASLVPEPTNPYDPKAVSVVIQGQIVGYLARDAAIAYAPVAAALAGWVGSCNATIRGGFLLDAGRQADFGVTLDLAVPEELLASI